MERPVVSDLTFPIHRAHARRERNPLIQQSLTAVHLACQSLLRDECNFSLAGGAQLPLTPEITMGFCKALDALADRDLPRV